MRGNAEPAVSRAVIIGGSLTGLFAAAALSGGDREVTVVERDLVPASPRPRDGVPQGGQAHVLLYRGLQAAETLLPGLRQDLLAEGAVPFNGGRLQWLSENGWLPTDRPGFEVVSLTRPLLEHIVHRRTFDLPGVRSVPGRRVTGLQRAKAGWTVALDDDSTLHADLVVDASGRTSRLPVWLAELGSTPPEETKIDARVGYATRTYSADPSVLASWPGVVVAATPETLAGGLALRVESDRWLVSAIGFGDRRPPRENGAFEDFLASLADPALADLVASSEAVDDVRVHRQTANLRRRYEGARNLPDGLVVVGDALCAFNPLYGQGVTVGAAQALVLRRAVQRGLRPGDSRRLQRKVAAEVNTAWDIATSEDLRFPTSDGSRSRFQNLLGDWTMQLGRMGVQGDRRAADALNRVYNLVSPPVLLVNPVLLAAAVRERVRGSGPLPDRPAALQELSAGRQVH